MKPLRGLIWVHIPKWLYFLIRRKGNSPLWNLLLPTACDKKVETHLALRPSHNVGSQDLWRKLRETTLRRTGEQPKVPNLCIVWCLKELVADCSYEDYPYQLSHPRCDSHVARQKTGILSPHVMKSNQFLVPDLWSTVTPQANLSHLNQF